MEDLFGNNYSEKPVHINIYADEVQNKECPYLGHSWHYIGIIIEDLSNPLLTDIVGERFKYNFDNNSPYYEKNNKIVHWTDISSHDEKNICKRWLEYVTNPKKSKDKFYSYILGLNDSFLQKEEFDIEDEFNSKYNKFFRTAVTYSLKVFFPNRKIIIENIFHEEGQQQYNKYFPWHIIYKLSDEENIHFNCEEINFLPKDHNKNTNSNMVQLCDLILGISTTIIHGIADENSRRFNYIKELIDIYSPMFCRMIDNPSNIKSHYQYTRRMMINFFPKEKTELGDIERFKNQFYTKRELYYIEKHSKQQCLPF